MFLTGKKEILTFCTKLRKSLAKRARGLEARATMGSKEGSGVSNMVEQEEEEQERRRSRRRSKRRSRSS